MDSEKFSCYSLSFFLQVLISNWLFLRRMRVVAFVMSVLILYMATLPCTDRGHSRIGAKQCLVSEAGDHTQRQADHCTPFCVCSCCATLVIVQSPYHTNPLAPQMSKKTYTHYVNPLNMEVANTIWQPPQASAC